MLSLRPPNPDWHWENTHLGPCIHQQRDAQQRLLRHFHVSRPQMLLQEALPIPQRARLLCAHNKPARAVWCGEPVRRPSEKRTQQTCCQHSHIRWLGGLRLAAPATEIRRQASWQSACHVKCDHVYTEMMPVVRHHGKPPALMAATISTGSEAVSPAMCCWPCPVQRVKPWPLRRVM
jgi:hypothetical protein